MWTLTNSGKLIDKIKNIKATWVETTQPSNPTAGSTYYDATNNTLMIYDWTQWNTVWWWWAQWSLSDHLWENRLVWELYTLNDKLFKQNAPTLSNSTLNCNISDVANNSQIHIQRIWSGVASNQLKLKIKKIWSPTQNLKVEVRKWVQVVVTQWVEAYWYWNQIIASWSISYWNITSDYTEITVTLNWDFWWTKWELLDVVLYMDTIDSSNYYCIACNNEQYSEAFRYISVNWTTRTTNYLMPYCDSNWFEKSLFVKAKTNTVTRTWNIWPYSKSFWFSSSWFIDIITNTTNSTMYVSATVPYHISAQNSSTHSWIDAVYVNQTWQVTFGGRVCDGSKYNIEVDGSASFSNISITPWTTFKVWYVTWSGYATPNSTRINSFSLSISINLSKNSNTVWLPTWIVWIWEDWSTIIFWLADWVFYVWEEKTTATAWSITPWNFVGYLQIGKYKIPYYNI